MTDTSAEMNGAVDVMAAYLASGWTVDAHGRWDERQGVRASGPEARDAEE